MKLVEIKALKENDIYKKIISELKLKGLDKLYIQKTESIDFFDIILSVLNFVEYNKKTIKKLNSETLENIVIILIDEILEQSEINVTEEQIEKILSLLKNSLLVQKTSKFVFRKAKELYVILKSKLCTCSKSKQDFV